MALTCLNKGKRKRLERGSFMTRYAYPTTTALERKQVVRNGEGDGSSEVGNLYPLISRDEAEVKALARKQIDKFFDRGKNLFHEGNSLQQAYYTDDVEEYKGLYVTGYVYGYLNRVAAMDKKEEEAGRKPRAASSTALGVKVTVTNVERGSREAIYTLEISDPGYLTQTVVFNATIPKG